MHGVLFLAWQWSAELLYIRIYILQPMQHPTIYNPIRYLHAHRSGCWSCKRIEDSGCMKFFIIDYICHIYICTSIKLRAIRWLWYTIIMISLKQGTCVWTNRVGNMSFMCAKLWLMCMWLKQFFTLVWLVPFMIHIFGFIVEMPYNLHWLSTSLIVPVHVMFN